MKRLRDSLAGETAYSIQMKGLLLTIAGSVLVTGTCFPQKTPLENLIDKKSSGWEQIKQMKSSARNSVEILPKNDLRADSALFETQFPTSSLIGSMIYECGGMLIDKGWIRILGSGCSRLNRSIPEWNKGKSVVKNKTPYSFLLIADDVLGGFFAIKMNGIDKPDSCAIYYYGPNSLKWKSTGFNYRTFIVYCFSGNLKRFYGDFRWKGWEEEVEELDGNQVISCYPLLWTKEGLELKVNRKILSIQRIWENYPQQTKYLAEQSYVANK